MHHQPGNGRSARERRDGSRAAPDSSAGRRVLFGAALTSAVALWLALRGVMAGVAEMERSLDEREQVVRERSPSAPSDRE